MYCITQNTKRLQFLPFTVIIKGLGEDSIKRLASVARQIENMDERLSTIEHGLETMQAQVDQRFDAVETMLTQILARLPKTP